MGEGKQRHGCLTAMLIALIVLNALITFVYFFSSASVRTQFPNAPEWAFIVLPVGGLINVVCAVALFRWKKWGFYGLVVTSVVALVINLRIGVDPFQAILGLAGLAILYGVLQIGGERKGWTPVGIATRFERAGPKVILKT